MALNENLSAHESEFLPERSDDLSLDTDTASDEGGTRTLKQKFSAFKGRYGYLALCFIIPAAIMWLIYATLGVYPFGEESVLVLDLNGQYVYYFEALRDILHGEGSFLYTFGRSLGGEFLGIVAYYLASPFSFIVALFPKNMITEALLAMFLLKVGLCGLTFGIYIHNTRKRNPVATVIFSTMYALTAYAVVYQHNTMWIDNVLFLPLILLGMEEMIRHGKYKLFVISLSLAVLSNFYIGYMTCIFVAVYFFYAYYSRTPEERNPLCVKSHFLKSFLRIALFSVIVLAIASAIILPAYYSLTFGKTTFSDPSFAPKQKFDFLDMITKMFFGSYDTVRPEGLPLLYCGMLTFLLIPLYFIAPHIKIREKIATGVVVLFLIVSFNTSTLDLIWHGFQRPNWLNYRYSFILCFLFVLMAYKAFERIKEIGFRPILLSVSAIAALLLVLQKFDYENLPDFSAVWASLAFCGVYLCILRAATLPAAETRKTAALVLAIFVSLEMFCAGFANIVALDADVVVSTRSSYRTFIDRVQPIVDCVKRRDDSFYRMEKTIHRKTNDNLALGMRGLSNSTSTLNTSVINLLNEFGYSSKSHWTKYIGGTPVSDSLLGIKYLIAEKDDEISSLYLEYISYADDLIAYENPYALPIAYCVDDRVALMNFSDPLYDSPFERMNALLGKMVGAEKDIEVFRDIKVNAIDYENCKMSMVVGHKKYAPEKSGVDTKIHFTITAPNQTMLYCYFPSDYPREVDLYVNNKHAGTFFGNESFAIKELGTFEEGEEIQITIVLKKDDLYIATNEPFFYYLDEELFKETMESIAAAPFVIEEYTEDSFYGTITAETDNKLVFTSIPYDAGWVVKVDGVKVETVTLLNSLLGFRIPEEGTHTLSLEYKPDCVKYAAIISGTGIVVFASICVGEALLNRHKKKKGRITV